MATLFTLLILLAASIICNAINPVDFINPPPAENPSEYPIWPAQSKQRLAWQTVHNNYNIYAIQDGAEGDDDVFSYMIYYTRNGSGLNTYDWTVDIPPETLARSPAFHFSFLEMDSSARMPYETGYFNVSDELGLAVGEPSLVASTTVTSSSTALSSSQTWMSSASAATTVSEDTDVAQGSLSPSTVSTSRTTASHTPRTSGPHLDPVRSTEIDTSVHSTATAVPTTLDHNIQFATGRTRANIQSPHEKNRLIWIGVGSGLGLPFVAAILVSVLWFGKKRRRRSFAVLNSTTSRGD